MQSMGRESNTVCNVAVLRVDVFIVQESFLSYI